MNAISKIENRQDILKVMQNTLYPGARPESVEMVLAYCKARGLDPMLKPVHIVPMWVKDAVTGQGGMRDVPMPGIGLYRIQAARTGEYAGKGEPEFGPDVRQKVGNIEVMFPKWCKVTVKRIVGGQERSFTATEFWIENYATAGKNQDEPNSTWRKRVYGQLAKCAEAQALRMAFPEEIGGEPTAEEMEGKSHAPSTFQGTTIDATAEPPRSALGPPAKSAPYQPPAPPAPPPAASKPPAMPPFAPSVRSAPPAAEPQSAAEDYLNDAIPDFDAPPSVAPPGADEANRIMALMEAATTLEKLEAVSSANREIVKAMPKNLRDTVITCYKWAKDAFEKKQQQVTI
jgi:phage recombination protein Bet